MNKPTYTAICERTGSWWAVDVPDVKGVHTQAKRLDQVDSTARDAIALMLGVAEDSFDIEVHPHLQEPAEDALRHLNRAAGDVAAKRRCRLAEPATRDGMIGKTASGRWRVRVKYQGRVVADRTFDRRTDASRWEAEQRRQLEQGDWVDPNRAKVTLAELVPAWLEHRQRTVAQRT